METTIGEWNTVIRLQDNLWLKIEEPRTKKDPTECNVTLHYSNPNLVKKENEEYEDSMDIDYEYHKETYDDQQQYNGDDD